jgi:hypothetical protein
VERSCQFIGDENDERKTEYVTIKQQMHELNEMYKEAESSIKTHQQEANKFKDILDLKARSMRENLLFYGIPESIHGINENCSELIKNL